MADEVLDARGLKCPIPVLRARKAIRPLAVGATLEVLATDPGAVKDFQAFSDATGHALEDWSQDGEEFRFLLRKKG